MDPKLSFIVPVYKVGSDRLLRCLNSISKAMKLVRNCEVIIVNDESPWWESEKTVIPDDKRFLDISHSKNLGLGAARNTGLDYASGNWVWFVDSDDSINPKVILGLISYLKKNPEVDVFQLGANQIDANGNKSRMYFNSDSEKDICGYEILTSNNIVPPCIWSKIYKRSYLRDNNLRNPEGVLYEDQEFLVRTAMTCATMKILPLVAYNYFENASSIMNSYWDLRHVFDAYRVIDTCIRLSDEIPEEYREGRYNEYKLTMSKAQEAYDKFDWKTKLKYHWKVIKWNIIHDL